MRPIGYGRTSRLGHADIIEGIDNRIKVIKRIAYYGNRDEGYFFLKIRAAFPGLAR